MLMASAASAQLIQMTAVSAQIKDASGSVYANCQWSIVFVGENTTPGISYAPQAVLNSQQGACDSSGNLTISLADNINTITPTPSQWSFSICSAQGLVGGPYCKTNILVTVTGVTQNLTSTFQPLMPLLPQLGINLSAPPVIGNVTSNAIFAKTLNTTTEYASQFPGADASCKIVAALTALPATGGTVDARDLTDAGGTGACTIDPGFGSTSQTQTPYTILLGAGPYNFSQIIVRMNLKLRGMGSYASNGTIIQATSTTLPLFVLPASTAQAVTGITLDGFRALGAASNHAAAIQFVGAGTSGGLWESIFNDLTFIGFNGPGVGTVNTSGTGVTWVSGTQFSNSWAGLAIIINNMMYTITSVNSATSITLSSTAGTQTGVSYTQGAIIDLEAISNVSPRPLDQFNNWTLIKAYRPANAGPDLELAGAIGQEIFDGCQFQGNSQGDGNNVVIGGLTPNSAFLVPNSIDFRETTTEEANLAYLIVGGYGIHLLQNHFEAVNGGVLEDFQTTPNANFVPTVTIQNSYFASNAGVNGGNGFDVKLNSASTDLQFIDNSILTTPDTIISNAAGGAVNLSSNYQAATNVSMDMTPRQAFLNGNYTNSTTSLTNVTAGGTNLAFTLTGVAQYFTFSCELFYQAASTGGLQIGFTGPTATSFVYSAEVATSNAAATPYATGVATAYSTKTPSTGVAVNAGATNYVARVKGSINPSAVGTLQLQAASVAAAQLTIDQGSFCYLYGQSSFQ